MTGIDRRLFLDVENSFDRVRHPGFLYKHVEILFPDCCIHLIDSFYWNRNFRVKVDNTRFSEKVIMAGVPQ